MSTVERTEQVINKIEKYMRLLRFQYTDLEKLSRLNIIKDYYDTIDSDANTETLRVKIESAEALSKDLVLPLKVRGIFLTEGRPKVKYYSAKELEKSVHNPVNKTFPLMLDHKDREAGKIIGKVTQITYDPTIKGIRWWGHINSETFARNILDGTISEVSATIYSVSEFTEANGLEGTNLTFKELSLVMEGAEPNNYIEVDRG